MQQHVELEIAERIRAGAAPAAARRQALRDFGSRERWIEEAREARGWGGWDAVRQDLRYAARSLAGAPGFTIAAVLTLALGIGANTAVFSVVNGVLLQPLGLHEPHRLVRLHDYRAEEIGTGWGTISYANFADMRERSRLWESAAAYDEWQVSMMVDGVAERYDGALVDAAWLDLLGVRPALGRFFGEEEAVPGAPSRVVLSWGLWQERFGGDPAIIGRIITTNGYPSEIIGVAPADFEDPGFSRGAFGAPRLWRSPPQYFTTNSRGSRSIAGMIRLRPGVTVAQAQQEADALQAQLAAEYPENNAGHVVRLVPLKETIVGEVRTELLILLGTVGLVLLIACANVGNLLLVRASARTREMSLRAALGASRVRLVRQLVVESALLAVLGAGLGGALAWAGALTSTLSEHLPRAAQVTPDGRVLAFTLLLTAGAAAVFGLLPALQGSRAELSGALRQSDRGSAGSRGQRRLRSLVVASEVALAIIVLIGAGLLTRSLMRLQGVESGIGSAEQVMSLELLTPSDVQDDRLTTYLASLLDAVRAVPGVRVAGAIDLLPMSGSFNGGPFTIVGMPEPPTQDRPSAELRTITGDAFLALGVPLVRGRLLGSTDRSDAPAVVVIDRTLAERFFPGENPIGRRILTYDAERTIVGVVADVRQFTLDRDPEPTIYFPNEQAPAWMRDDPTVVVRTDRASASAMPELRAAIREVDARVAIANVRSLDRVIDDTLMLPRMRTMLLLLFSAIALVLAIIGIYGTVAYSVARRTREFGIRMAMGAQRRDILKLVLGRGLAPVLAGAVGGTVLALFASRLLQSLLYDTSPLDARTFLLVPLSLVMVAAAAAALPARRAASAAPVRALRED